MTAMYIHFKKPYVVEIKTITNISIFYSKKEYYVYFGRPSCPECIRFQRSINSNNHNLPKKIYYFNTDYWRKSGITYKICKEFNVEQVPALIKIKNGKCIERRDLSKFIN